MSPLNNEPRRLPKQRQAKSQPRRQNNSTESNIPKTTERAASKGDPLNKALISVDAHPWPNGTRANLAGQRSPLPPQGLGYCSTRSSARAEEHLMCSSCEQDCLSMEQNLSPAAEGDGQPYSVSPGRAPRARASWYSLTALMRCIGFSRSNMVLPCR